MARVTLLGLLLGRDKLLYFIVKALVIVKSDRLLPSRLALIACHEVNEFAENCRLKLEFDTVDDALENGLDVN